MKVTLINMARKTGGFALFRLANRHKALIMTYHRFSHGRTPAAISAHEFAEHVQYLTKNYRLLSLSEVARRLRNGEALRPGTAVITIDDGYRDAYEIAFPILRRFNAPATLFAITDFLDQKGWLWTDKLRYAALRTQATSLEASVNNQSFQSRLNGTESRFEAANRLNSVLKQVPDEMKEGAIADIASSLGVDLPACPPDEFGPVTWEQAREMDASGVELGSHTKSHPILTQVDDARLRSELVESRSRLEAMLDREVDLFCYPNGDYDDRVRHACAQAGYGCAVTVELGFNRPGADLLHLRRMDAEANFLRFLQITSGFDQVKNGFRRALSGGPNLARHTGAAL